MLPNYQQYLVVIFFDYSLKCFCLTILQVVEVMVGAVAVICLTSTTNIKTGDIVNWILVWIALCKSGYVDRSDSLTNRLH